MTQARLQSRRYWREEYATATVVRTSATGLGRSPAPPRLVATNLSHRTSIPRAADLVLVQPRRVEDIDVDDLNVWNRAGDRVIRPSEMR